MPAVEPFHATPTPDRATEPRRAEAGAFDRALDAVRHDESSPATAEHKASNEQVKTDKPSEDEVQADAIETSRSADLATGGSSAVQPPIMETAAQAELLMLMQAAAGAAVTSPEEESASPATPAAAGSNESESAPSIEEHTGDLAEVALALVPLPLSPAPMSTQPTPGSETFAPTEPGDLQRSSTAPGGAALPEPPAIFASTIQADLGSTDQATGHLGVDLQPAAVTAAAELPMSEMAGEAEMAAPVSSETPSAAALTTVTPAPVTSGEGSTRGDQRRNGDGRGQKSPTVGESASDASEATTSKGAGATEHATALAPASETAAPAQRPTDSLPTQAAAVRAPSMEAPPPILQAKSDVALQPSATPAHPAPATASAETIAHLSASIIRRLEGRSTRFDVELHPAELGGVQVRLEINRDGQVQAQLAFDNPLAAADLRARADELRRSLEQAGFHVAQDALSFEQREAGSGFAGRDQDQKPHGAVRLRAFQNGADVMAAADASLVRPTRGLTSGIDLRI